jgi:hypothetical protein
MRLDDHNFYQDNEHLLLFQGIAYVAKLKEND